MPAKSPAQKRFMDAAAHNPAFAKKVGVPVKVAKEFSNASKGETFKKGNEMATKKMSKGGSTDAGMSRTMKPVKTAAPSRDGVASKGKTKGKQFGIDGPKMPSKTKR